MTSQSKPRPPRKVSPEYLRRAGLHYLERYHATQQSLRQVLMRRVTKHLRAYGGEREEMVGWVEAVIAEFVAKGFVNDGEFALSRGRSLLTSGQSLRAVRMRLAQKGIASEQIDQAIGRLIEESDAPIDQAAAWAYARKRRLGPFRDEPQRAERRDKDLAALARRGFAYDLAKKIIDFEGDPFEEAVGV